MDVASATFFNLFHKVLNRLFKTMSNVRAIPLAEGQRRIAKAISDNNRPLYSQETAERAAKVADRFCYNELTESDRRHSVFVFNQASIEAAVEEFKNENERFQEMFMGDSAKRAIGCAEATCRGNSFLVCRPNSPEVGELDTLSPLAGFEETKEGCEVPAPFRERTRAMYDKSDFKSHIADQIFVKLGIFDRLLLHANKNLAIGEKPQLRREQMGASQTAIDPVIQQTTKQQRDEFTNAALDYAYLMYFPSNFELRTTPLDDNELNMLFWKALEKVPLVSKHGVELFEYYGYNLIGGLTFSIDD